MVYGLERGGIPMRSESVPYGVDFPIMLILLDFPFFVKGMSFAVRTIFFECHFFWLGFFVFVCRVVTSFTLLTDQTDQIPHGTSLPENMAGGNRPNAFPPVLVPKSVRHPSEDAAASACKPS
jgi:hypothetical protein